ncbi:hypothetical protein BKA24_001756 [Microbacterium marinum]|uniref:Uncharacterized protein n=1 Tax=Microbacterium marinum TaxID=421115 RepID=A0A7W7BQM5_9MICO|nr:hypothetical protein [Microbacterium marinum]MBB4667047.1 hypothetical protein [Microbacterium marinum]
MHTAASAAPTLPNLPPNLTAELMHVEGGEQWGAPVQWRDYLVTRRHGDTLRPVAEVTVYPDGRTMARRHHAVRGTLDARAWAAIVDTLHADPACIATGVIMAPNPA